MTRLRVSSPVDHRRLSMLPQHIARQHPGRREHVHGPIVPMQPDRDPLGTFALKALPIAGMVGMVLFFLSQGIR